MLKPVLAACALLCVLSSCAISPVLAKPIQPCTWSNDPMRPTCVAPPNFLAGVKSIKVTMKRVRVASGQIVPHPTGCPARSFCGCGAAVRIFGKPVRSLWLAANWFKFQRAQPSPGMVAVRRHHVFVLEQHLNGNVWLAFDANAGRHLTLIHPRSIAGYAIVNPHGAS